MEDLFHAALERAPEGRQSFLDIACNGDTNLRFQVEFLLSEEERAGSFLEVPALDDITVTRAAGPAPVRHFGGYRIISPLGAGGMGEVYQAHDTKLGRNVAIKILPFEVARDPERLARFRREARILASLNHPNIATIYELVEDAGAADYLVLELVDGETLRGPLPVATALQYALQVADALQAAHDNGIIHRDLKPANVMVTAQGRVKVLDFGLAKAIRSPEGDHDPSHAAEKLNAVSLAGHIAGTPGYMSPEQARGEAVGPQVDIWAFGCLLYELLTGKRAFAGETLHETVTAVLNLDPDWQALPAKTPAKIHDLLRQCVQKDAGRRPQSITHARRMIERAQRGSNLWRVDAIPAAALAVAALGAILWLRGPVRPPERSEWVQITRLPDPVSQPALSPDGRILAFVRSSRTWFAAGEIYIKRLPDGDPIQLTHDGFAKMSPAFSWDGERIAYTVVDTQLNWDTWVVPVSSREDAQLWRPGASDLVWTAPREVLFAKIKTAIQMGIVRGSETGAEEREVYLPFNERGGGHRPSVSPDGKWVLLTEIGDQGGWLPCRVVPIDGSSSGRQVGPPGAACTFGAWSPDSKWLYVTSKAGGLFHIWRQRFPDGEPEQFTYGLTEEEGIAMAPDGRSIVTAVGLQSASIWIHDAKGERQISLLEGNAAYPRFTPDGKKLCYRILKAVPVFGTVRDPGEVWVADLSTGHSERLAPGFPVLDYDISKDGSQIVMEALDDDGKPRLWLAPLDRRSRPVQIPGVEGRCANFGPTGEIFFRRTEGSSGFSYRVRPDGTGLRKALERPILHVGGILPDGRWMRAWAPLPGNEPPATQVIPLDGGPPVVIGGTTLPQWSSSGDSLWISAGAVTDGRSYIIPLLPGQLLPKIPPGGFRSEQEIARLPGARMIDFTGAPGPTRDIYAFERRTVQRNLYRIPIP